MIDPKIIREKTDILRDSLKKRGASFDVERLLECDEKRRSFIQESERMKSEKNDLSGEIARLKKSGMDAQENITHLKDVGKRIDAAEQELKEVEKTWDNMILLIPNIP